MSGLESNWNITFNNKYLDCVTFHLQLTQYIHNTLPNLVTLEFLLFIQSQLTTNVQNALHMDQCTYRHLWSWTVAPFPRSRGGCE